VLFDGVAENPTTDHVADGLAIARNQPIDIIMALGGGSAMDCAKGINLLHTNGGGIADYWGIDKAVRPLLPMVAAPTTAGTGSEAQSFALISDVRTHRKMACGDRRPPSAGGLRPRVAILDPELTATAPRRVAAAAGIDAIAHAVETAASRVRTNLSRSFSTDAWRLLAAAFETSMLDPLCDWARAHMLLGAHVSGAAIEQSMLGAAHACANPLTARFGITHGAVVGLMLPHVVRFNAAHGPNPYADLMPDAEALANRLTSFLEQAQLPLRLRDHGIPESSFSELAALAVQEWTAGFNPRPIVEDDMLRLYQEAF
jgi:alcohol dehydrogenase